MPSRLRVSLTYANVMATIAVFIALGGSGYAAVKLPKNSVGPKQLRANAVTSSKVKRGSLLSSDFKASQRAGLRGPEGPRGAQGPQGLRGSQGSQGAAGTRGPSGFANPLKVRSVTVNVPSGGGNSADAACNSGERPVGGSVSTTTTFGTFAATGFPITSSGNLVGWRGIADQGSAPGTMTVYVNCAS
jgi:hypothetical protein